MTYVCWGCGRRWNLNRVQCVAHDELNMLCVCVYCVRTPLTSHYAPPCGYVYIAANGQFNLQFLFVLSSSPLPHTHNLMQVVVVWNSFAFTGIMVSHHDFINSYTHAPHTRYTPCWHTINATNRNEKWKEWKTLFLLCSELCSGLVRAMQSSPQNNLLSPNKCLGNRNVRNNRNFFRFKSLHFVHLQFISFRCSANRINMCSLEIQNSIQRQKQIVRKGPAQATTSIEWNSNFNMHWVGRRGRELTNRQV